MKHLSILLIAGAIFVTGVLTAVKTFDVKQVQTPAPQVGTFSPTGGGTYRLGASIGSSNTTVKLSSFKEPVSNIPYTMAYLNSDIGYGTIDPQTTRSEFVSFTGITQNSDGSALLTGVSRGLTRTPAGSNCTASSTLAQAHAGQSIFILSDSPCLFAEYLPARSPATSTAILTFSSTTQPRYDYEPTPTMWNNATGTVFVTLNKLADTALAGTVNATQAVKGILQLATGLQAASTTSTGSSGANLALSTLISTSTPGSNAGNLVPVTRSNGKLDQSFIDLTQSFNWTALHVFTAASTTRLSVFSTLYIGGSATSTLQGNTTGTSTLQGFLNIAGTGSTSTISSFLSVTATTTLTGCLGCLSGYEQVTNTGAGPTTATQTSSATATCTNGKKVMSGGASNGATDGKVMMFKSYPSAANTWSAEYVCFSGSGGCAANTITVYAVCAYP